MDKSHCYNPFVYLRDDNDIQRLVTNLFKNTTPKGSQSQDPFWDQAATMLLLALVFYLHYEAPEDEQNFPMVMEMIRAGEVREDNDEYMSPLDELFERLEMRNPEHIALKYYRAYHSGSGKTLKSIQITLVSRLEKFNLTSLAGITQTDEWICGVSGSRKRRCLRLSRTTIRASTSLSVCSTPSYSSSSITRPTSFTAAGCRPCPLCHGRVRQCCAPG